jgi:hypothetical protein
LLKQITKNGKATAATTEPSETYLVIETITANIPKHIRPIVGLP